MTIFRKAHLTTALDPVFGGCGARRRQSTLATACTRWPGSSCSTCKMAADLIAAAGIRVHLGGNIGGSLLKSLDRIEREDVVVLELSSYQLEHLATDPHASDHAAKATQ